jgi:ABC-type multidrug transport system fused ATPase/permease subunit
LPVHLRLLTFLKPYMKQVAFTWAVVIAAALFAMVTPRLLQWGVDTGLKPPAVENTGAQLAADVGEGTSVLLLTDTGRVRPDYVIRLGTEKLRVTAVSGNEVTVDRGLDGSSAVSHPEGTRVFHVIRTSYSGKLDTLVLAAGAIVGAAALRGFFTYWQTFMGEWLGQHVAFDLRNRIYEKLQRLSFAYHDKQQTGQLMSRATQDVEGTRMYISMGAVRLLDIVFRLSIAAVFMFTSDWRLGLIAWAILPIVAVRSIQVQLEWRRVWYLVQDAQGRVTTVLQEALTGVRVVKAFSRENEESRKFGEEATELFNHSFRSNRIQAWNTPFYSFVGMLTQVVVLWVGAVMVTGGDLTPGKLTGFLAYLALLLMPMRMLGFVVSTFARADASGRRIFEVLDAESAVKEKPGAIELENIRGHVRYESVSFGYDAISPVLREVDIDVPPGKVIALLGPTGCGKTTVVNLLPRFYDVTGGRITIDGIDIRDVTLASLRRNIGIIQQDVFLFSATIRDNIAYGAVEATYEQIIEAAKIARIHDFIMSLPDGYDTWVGERGITLSGGQKQRISIARTLLLDPRILILDDSTSSVDTQTEFLIQQALAEVMKGRSTLVIAQRLRTVKNADEILVMREGRIVERGTHQELIERGGIYREIYDLELRDQEEALTGRGAASGVSGGGAG